MATTPAFDCWQTIPCCVMGRSKCLVILRNIVRLLQAASIVVVLSFTTSYIEAAEALETAQRLAIEWAKLRDEKSRIETEWSRERELMESTSQALRERTQALEEKRKLVEARTATVRRQEELDAQKNAALTTGIEQAQQRLRKMTEELTQMRPLLPPRLSRALELPFKSLEDPALGPGERMQLLTTAFNRCLQFNGSITLSEEVLALEGSGERLLEVLYWGLAQAYALDRDGKRAYVGRPGPKGWSWEARPDAVEKISAAIAIYRDELAPRFVLLPAKVGQLPASTSKD